MDEKLLRGAFSALDVNELPAFETVAARRAPRRIRKVRAGLVAFALIAGAAALPLLRSAQSPDVTVALVRPPTTDWLLQTPDPDWIADLDRPPETEGETHVP